MAHKFLLLFQLVFTFEAVLSLECGEYYGGHLHNQKPSTMENTILETRIVNGELASLGEFPWQISMQRRVKPRIAAGSEAAAALPGIASTKPEVPLPMPPIPSLPTTPVDKIEAHNSTNELTEDKILDDSLWGRFLWPILAAQKNITFTQAGVVIEHWPPPIPTHPPGSQTFPPLPTHPPGQRLPPTHAPGSQTFPPMPPMPTFPPGIGGSRPWSPPPGQKPSQTWPPPVPSHPPRLPPTAYPPIITPSPPPRLPSTSYPPIITPSTHKPPLPTPPPQTGNRPRPPLDQTQKWQHFCGGSIIDASWILTAAHCVEALKHTYTPGLIRVVAGSLDWRNIDESRAQVIPVDRIVVHPGWSQQSGQNDVALLHLQSPVEFTRESERVVTVNKVCLSKAAEAEHSGMATSSGWGFLNKDQRVSPDLMRRVDIPVVDHASCRNAFSRVIGVTQNQVCAGQAPKGNCMGDSGGPLVQKMGGSRATQIGIVSFSIPCAVPGYPDVFTRVAKYIDWISSNSGIAF